MMRYRFSIFICGFLAALASPARAQTASPPLFLTTDDNGVDLVNGGLTFAMTEGSIGPADDPVTMDRYWTTAGWTDNWSGTLAKVSGTEIVITFGQIADKFTLSGGTWVSAKGDGSTLTVNAAGDTYTYTAGDGTVIAYSISYDNNVIHTMTVFGANGCQSTNAIQCALPDRIVEPNGRTTNLTWDVSVICTDPEECATAKMKFRLFGVSDNRGYGFGIAYADNTGTVPAVPAWYQRTTLTFANSKVAPPNTATVTYAYPASGVVEVTDPAARTWRLTSGAGGPSIRRPGSATDDITASQSGTLLTVTRDGVATTYNRVVSGSTATTTITDALGKTSVAVANLTNGRVTSFKDELNRTTGYQYDASARPTRVTSPEGNYTQLTYNSRGDVTQTRKVAKSGSGLADIVASAAYPASCVNPKTCNQPTSSTDPRGSVTDYTYDSTHGGVLTATSPAPATGAVRPQTRYSYALTNGEYVLTGVSACQTLASCAGGADEAKATLAYDSNKNLVTLTRGNGTGSLAATQAMTWDAIGNLLTVDGPLAGTADTTRYRYDAARQLVGLVGPDPDGGGALKNRAVRVTYRPDGQASKQELGTVNGQTDPDWASFVAAQTVDIAFAANNRPSTRTLFGGGTAFALTQMSYDALGRPDCSAVRMSPAAYAALPVSACTLGTEGSFGPDRIGQTVYDNAGQVIQNKVAVGTADAATERTLTYSANGMLATLKDAEANLTTYEYDGFDRPSKTRFPVTAKGANASSTTDYEQLTYDAGSNVTQRRMRDGQLVGYTFDKLNRVTFEDTPSNVWGEFDRSFGYDNLSRRTSAKDEFSGLVESFGYDALSRLLTQSDSAHGAIATSQYDLAGRRTRLTWRDGFFVDYDYLVTGEPTKIRENGATTGVGVLADYAYDDLGNRTSVTFGNGVVQAFAYDPVSRLASLSNDLFGTANDLSATFAYNPARQIASTTRTGDAYAWTGHHNENVNSTANGLNQLTQVGSVSPTYDGRGNLISDGTSSYVYTATNLLTTTPSSFYAYDPSGRLARRTVDLTGFEYDGSDVILESNYFTNAILRRYVHGPGIDEPIVWYEGSGTTDRRFLSSDERGSIVSVTDSSGNLLGINRYDEFGVPQGTNIGRFQYTGQMWLSESGLYYYKNRMYRAPDGRFMQTDPIGYADSPNLYAYVLNDPVNFADPWGLLGCAASAGEIVVCGHRIVNVPAAGGRTGVARRSQARRVPRLAPNQQQRQVQCQTAAIAGAALSVTLDSAGLIPGERAVSVLTRIFASSTQGARALVSGDAAGGALAAGGYGLDLAKAGIISKSEAAKAILGSIPLLNLAVVSASVSKDIYDAVENYKKCSVP